jgi:NAD(P)-dependent dehydrogenase (short-subunit alcohol dehydrogenase family)
MTTLKGKNALVIGGSSGIGKATVQALLSDGAQVTAVARGADRLASLAAEVGDKLALRCGDATDEAFVNTLLREQMPDLLVMAAGVMPHMARIDEFDWASFSEPWNGDLKATFHLVRQALTLPLRPGSTFVIVSSGAAARGSPMSGGYAGAKRMQWLLASYAQGQSDARQLGIRFVAVVPEQLLEGTAIGTYASTTYATLQGITAEAFMARYEKPLDAKKVADAILAALRGEFDAGVTAIAVNGARVEALK